MSPSSSLVTLIELAAWGMDPTPYRDIQPASPPQRPLPSTPTLQPLSAQDKAAFARLLTRPDLAPEFAGLAWSLQFVDLRTLIAFQRRLALDPTHPIPPLASLMDLCFPPPRLTTHNRPNPNTLRSANPDLQLRPSPNGFTLIAGSPFVEVTLEGTRAYLRDGYHRAYHLLQAGIHIIPAVVVQVNHPSEICPADPCFFPLDVLLGPTPPLVTDFLNPTLTLLYQRPRLVKTIHVTITESMEPAP